MARGEHERQVAVPGEGANLIAIVTGAFSNIGSAVARELLSRGWSVRTLTNHSAPDPGPIAVAPLTFDAAALERSLSGADVLVNTYWIRYPRGATTFDTAVRNSRLLLDAAMAAGIRRFVQVSVSNASLDSELGYYRGKAQVAEAVRASAPSWAIVRPTLVVGPKDVLTNNIAWFLRRFPVFLLPEGGGYRLQPITRDDLAGLVADAAAHSESLEFDAAGPDVLTFEQYVRHLARAIGVRRAFVRCPPATVMAALGVFGAMLGGTVLTAEELEGLRQDRLVSHHPARGVTSVLDWIDTHASGFGNAYSRDLRTPPGSP